MTDDTQAETTEGAPSDETTADGGTPPVMHEDDKSTVAAAPPPSSGSVETTPTDSVPADSGDEEPEVPTFEQALVAEGVLEGEDDGEDKVREVRAATFAEGADPDIDTGGATGRNIDGGVGGQDDPDTQKDADEEE